MPFPRKLLNDHETVAVDLHPHWWFFAKPVTALVLSIIASVIAVAADAADWIRWICLIALIASIVWVVVQYGRWVTTNFVITSDRVIFRTGVISKTGIEIPLERVNTVHFSQTMFERIVGAGDLMIESGGTEGQQRFTDIRRPDRVQKEIHVQMEVNQERRRGDGAASSTDVASQLEKLEGMLERGTLSREEFDAQKAKLLGS